MPQTPKFIEATQAPTRNGSRYPKPYDAPCLNRTKFLLGNAFDLTQFGVNLVTLEAGAWSSQRHWHEKEDEFIYIVSGEATLCDDKGEHVLKAGMCAGFKAGVENGHCLKNLSNAPVQYLEMGTRGSDEVSWYSDIDMKVVQKWSDAK